MKTYYSTKSTHQSTAIWTALILLTLTLFVVTQNAQAVVQPSSLVKKNEGMYENGIERAQNDSQRVFLPLALRNVQQSQGGACIPGVTMLDPDMDVPNASIDVLGFSTALVGDNLQAVLHLRDIPEKLTFDRVGVPQHMMEYSWNVYVDADNDSQTGSPGIPGSPLLGMEYVLSARHFVFYENNPVSLPLADGVQVNVWRYMPVERHWITISRGTLEVDAQADTLALAGTIPGILPNSRIIFQTYDYNPGGSGMEDLPSDCSP
jgi:hypothetical protein